MGAPPMSAQRACVSGVPACPLRNPCVHLLRRRRALPARTQEGFVTNKLKSSSNRALGTDAATH